MAEDPRSQGVLTFSLSDEVPVADLQALLQGLGALYEAADALLAAASGEAASPETEESGNPAPLLVYRIAIGTPNEASVKGRLEVLAAVLTIVAATLAIHKAGLETAAAAGAVGKGGIEVQTARLQRTAAEIALQEQAQKARAEGRISPERLAEINDLIQNGKEATRRSVGIVTGEPRLAPAASVDTDTQARKALERARALNVGSADTDLFLAVYANDTTLLKRALENGADPNAKLGQVLRAALQRAADDPVLVDHYARWLAGAQAGPASAA